MCFDDDCLRVLTNNLRSTASSLRNLLFKLGEAAKRIKETQRELLGFFRINILIMRETIQLLCKQPRQKISKLSKCS